jgi:5-methylcytosine-specific restriction endonuclease McrA
VSINPDLDKLVAALESHDSVRIGAVAIELYSSLCVARATVERMAISARRDAERKQRRADVTTGVRYAILRRDGFRCVLCGATADDGATLHVDHIVPVVDGGTGSEQNLRTLCADCNLGKGTGE